MGNRSVRNWCLKEVIKYPSEVVQCYPMCTEIDISVRQTRTQFQFLTNQPTNRLAIFAFEYSWRKLIILHLATMPHFTKMYLLSAGGSSVSAFETLGVEYKHTRRVTECHVVIGHRQYPRDTCPRYLDVQYGERHITPNFRHRYQPSSCEENISSILYFLQITTL